MISVRETVPVCIPGKGLVRWKAVRLWVFMLKQFRRQFPLGSFTSELLMIDHGLYLVRATIKVDGIALASGMAAAATLETAEDTARSRALALLDLPLLEEPFEEPSNLPPVVEQPTATPEPAKSVSAPVPSKTHAPISPAPTPPLEPTTKTAKAVKAPPPVSPSPPEPPLLTLTPEPPAEVLPLETLAPEPVASEPLLSEPLLSEPPLTLAEEEPAVEPAPEPAKEPETPTQAVIPTEVPQPPIPEELPLPEPEPLTLTEPIAFVEPEPQLTLVTETVELGKTEPTSTNGATPPPLDFSQPVDFTEVITRTNLELKRLGWTNDQGKNYLLQTYGKRSRHLLSDEELLEFLLYLESQPTPSN
ncbi:MAG: hypothetical protein VKK07_00405 [Merismopediaceae bacterium]|nr:hypothetical protein [Merismopediaceae bacterium]